MPIITCRSVEALLRRATCLVIVAFFGCTAVRAQTVTGTVTDSDTGAPLPGATVMVRGTTTGTTTGLEGGFSLEVPSLQDTLVFSFLGYQTSEVPIAGRSIVNIALQVQAIMGEDVVVTGYMQEEKADLTGAVSVIDAEQLEGTNYSNVAQTLQGKVPGVIIQTDGDPRGNASIQIRGITSVNANPPLIVVDGMPTQLNLNDINPATIASIQVLRDAAAASIYGSRAASGVILIETEKGARGGTVVNYQSTIGGSRIMQVPDMLNTQQYGQALWQAAVNDGLDPNEQTQLYTYEWHTDANGAPVLESVTPRQWLNPEQTMPSADTDWWDEVLQTGLLQKHQLSISTGTDKSRTMFSIGLYQNEGTVIHTGLKRYTAQLNSDFDLIDGKLRVGENLSLSHRNFSGDVGGSIRNMLIMPSIVPVYTNDGEWGGTAYSYGMDDYNNPVRELTMGKDNRNNESRVLGTVFLEFSPIGNLVLKTQGGLDYLQGYGRYVDYTWREGGGKQDTQNGISNNHFQNRNFTWTNTATYTLRGDVHNMTALGGVELYRHVWEGFDAYRQDIEIEDPDYAYLNTATGNLRAGGGGDERAALSYFTKVNYEYGSRYLLSATVRYDGASVFGANNRYAFFPAVSAGWRISEESFFGDDGAISDLKLRASWGKNGNSNIPTTARFNFYDADYYWTAYAIDGRDSGQLASGYRKIQSGNPDLQWEETTQFNIGIDYGLFDDKIVGTLDVYQKSTEGMLFNPPYIGAAGEGAGQWYNAADMLNRGIEFSVTYRNAASNDLDYAITFNAASNRNEITNLPSAVRFAYGGNGIDDDIQGRPLNSFYGFVADGLFRSQAEVDAHAEQRGAGIGRIRYKDLNGDGLITWDRDRTWIGSSDPDLDYGINLDVGFKNWDFSMFWHGVMGNTLRNDWLTYSDFWNVWTQAGFNHSTRVLDAWSPQNPDSDIPALSLSNANDERRLSTYFLESGAFLKLRNIEIGYTLPFSLGQRIGAQHLRVFANADNVLTIKKWWGDDAYTGPYPETSTKAGEYSNPYMRPAVFTMGVDITF